MAVVIALALMLVPVFSCLDSAASAAPQPSVIAVAFPGRSSGWALGTRGGQVRIWHTATAGGTWRTQWRGSGTPLSIGATDSAHAWALIACTGTRPGCGRELLGTSDGGRRWRLRATLPEPVNQVSFATASLGVAISDRCLADLALTRCPGQVLVSRDGGTRWVLALSSPEPVFATAGRSGLIWAARLYSGTGVRFLSSADGGRTWRRLGQLTGLGPLSPEVRVTLSPPAPPRGVHRLAWASVVDPLSCTMRGCAVAGLRGSSDGGRGWRPVELPAGRPDSCASDGIVFSVAPAGTVWAATSRNGAACPPPRSLLYRYVPVPPAWPGWRRLPSWPLAAVVSLIAVSQDVAYAVTGQGTLSRTADGGQHWTQVLPAPGRPPAAPRRSPELLGLTEEMAAATGALSSARSLFSRSARTRKMSVRSHRQVPTGGVPMYDATLAETITIHGGGGDEIEAYAARPLQPGPVGGVVVIHHMPGYDEGTKEITRTFAAHGYNAIMPNLYHRDAPGASPDDAAAAARARGGVPDERLVGDVAGAAAYLRGLTSSNGKVGVIGYCSGGRQSVLAACSLPLQAAVDCYGALVVGTPYEGMTLKIEPIKHLITDLSCPLLGLFGADDQRPSPAEVAELEEELKARDKTYEFHVYEGAGHAFFNVTRPAYRPDAAMDGWQHIWSWFGRYLT